MQNMHLSDLAGIHTLKIKKKYDFFRMVKSDLTDYINLLRLGKFQT